MSTYSKVKVTSQISIKHSGSDRVNLLIFDFNIWLWARKVTASSEKLGPSSVNVSLEGKCSNFPDLKRTAMNFRVH